MTPVTVAVSAATTGFVAMVPARSAVCVLAAPRVFKLVQVADKRVCVLVRDDWAVESPDSEVDNRVDSAYKTETKTVFQCASMMKNVVHACAISPK